MARKQSMRLRRRIRNTLPKERVRTAALNSGFQQRSRKFNVTTFLWSLVFSIGLPGPRTIQSLRTEYLKAARQKLEKSAFYRWLSKPAIVSWLHLVITATLASMARAAPKRLRGALAQFRELFVTDSSTLQLPDCLQKLFPGSRTNHSPAALKVHVIEQNGGGGLRSFGLSEGKASDSKKLHVGPWVRGALLLADLGYYCFTRFARITELGGYFISRVKDTANPLILRSLRTHRGQKVPIEGSRLQIVLARLRRKVVDFEVEVEYKKRAYRGTRRKARLALRLVGIWDEAERKYHLYFTNIPPEKLTAEQVAAAYSLRWQVEIFFRELKGVHKMADLPGKNPYVIQALVLVSILSSLVTRRLVEALRQRLGMTEADLPREQGARLVANVSALLVHLATGVGRHLRGLEKLLEDLLSFLAGELRTARSNLPRRRDDLTGFLLPETMS